MRLISTLLRALYHFFFLGLNHEAALPFGILNQLPAFAFGFVRALCACPPGVANRLLALPFGVCNAWSGFPFGVLNNLPPLPFALCNQLPGIGCPDFGVGIPPFPFCSDVSEAGLYLSGTVFFCSPPSTTASSALYLSGDKSLCSTSEACVASLFLVPMADLKKCFAAWYAIAVLEVRVVCSCKCCSFFFFL